MKKRNGEFRCVYAGPDFFDRKNGQKPDENKLPAPENDELELEVRELEPEAERPSYPDSFKEGGEVPCEAEKRRNTMRILYAGPELRNKNNIRWDEPLMQAVYACPPMPPVSDEREQLVSCPICGAVCSDGANFCASCGARLIKPRFCCECGNKLNEAANFCPSCGAKASDAGREPPKKPTLRKGFLARPNGSRDELV